jgi:hypothetical protein
LISTDCWAKQRTTRYDREGIAMTMTIVSVYAFSYRWSHRGSGYSTGPTHTIDHLIAPATISLHAGLSQVQATTDGPLGASIGIMSFGEADYGPDPGGWPPFQMGLVGSFTVGMQVTKGDMTVCYFFHVWE